MQNTTTLWINKLVSLTFLSSFIILIGFFVPLYLGSNSFIKWGLIPCCLGLFYSLENPNSYFFSKQQKHSLLFMKMSALSFQICCIASLSAFFTNPNTTHVPQTLIQSDSIMIDHIISAMAAGMTSLYLLYLSFKHWRNPKEAIANEKSP